MNTLKRLSAHTLRTLVLIVCGYQVVSMTNQEKGKFKPSFCCIILKTKDVLCNFVLLTINSLLLMVYLGFWLHENTEIGTVFSYTVIQEVGIILSKNM